MIQAEYTYAYKQGFYFLMQFEILHEKKSFETFLNPNCKPKRVVFVFNSVVLISVVRVDNCGNVWAP